MKRIVESYKDLLQTLSKHLKIVDYDLLKLIPLENHKQMLREFFERNDKEDIMCLNESLSEDPHAVFEGFIQIAKQNLALNFDTLKESIINKLKGYDSNIPQLVDYIIDCLIIHETLRLVFDETFALNFLKNLSQTRKRLQESVQVLKKMKLV